MNFALLVLAASSLIVPATATGQALTALVSVTDSGSSAFATFKANRAGISANRTLEASPLVRNDTVGSTHRGTRADHVVVGGALGILVGAAIGGGAGYWFDTRPNNDGMIPATYILGIYGAVGGLVLGLFTGLVWPVK
jgi:hypothetical protein